MGIFLRESAKCRIIISRPEIVRFRLRIPILTAVAEIVGIGTVRILLNTKSVVAVCLRYGTACVVGILRDPDFLSKLIILDFYRNCKTFSKEPDRIVSPACCSPSFVYIGWRMRTGGLSHIIVKGCLYTYSDVYWQPFFILEISVIIQSGRMFAARSARLPSYLLLRWLMHDSRIEGELEPLYPTLP